VFGGGVYGILHLTKERGSLVNRTHLTRARWPRGRSTFWEVGGMLMDLGSLRLEYSGTGARLMRGT